MGPIYIHGDCQIGKNFKIHPMTVISKPLGHNDKYPVIGDDALVNKDVEAYATYANPAQKINDKGYRDYFKQG